MHKCLIGPKLDYHFNTLSTLIAHSSFNKKNQNKQRLAEIQIVMTTNVLAHEIGPILPRDN